MQFEPAFSSNSVVAEHTLTTMIKKNTHSHRAAHISVHSSHRLQLFPGYCDEKWKKRARTHTQHTIPYLDFKSRFDEKLFGVVRLKSNHSVISLVCRCFYFILFFAFSPLTQREWNVLSMDIEMDWDQSQMQAQNASFISATGLAESIALSLAVPYEWDIVSGWGQCNCEENK